MRDRQQDKAISRSAERRDRGGRYEERGQRLWTLKHAEGLAEATRAGSSRIPTRGQEQE